MTERVYFACITYLTSVYHPKRNYVRLGLLENYECKCSYSCSALTLYPLLLTINNVFSGDSSHSLTHPGWRMYTILQSLQKSSRFASFYVFLTSSSRTTDYSWSIDHHIVSAWRTTSRHTWQHPPPEPYFRTFEELGRICRRSNQSYDCKRQTFDHYWSEWFREFTFISPFVDLWASGRGCFFV